jgi:hypothetical protein
MPIAGTSEDQSRATSIDRLPRESPEEMLADGRWFPFRFDSTTDEFRFAFIPSTRHRQTPFLIYLQPEPNELRAIARSELSAAQIPRTDLHFILHLGFGGSTLLGRLLAQPGVAITLQEPPVLTDVAQAAVRTERGKAAELLRDTARLLSRPIAPGETTICKMTHLGNALASSMATLESTSQILCLQTPMEEMLLSLALRGLEGRISARRIFVSMLESNLSIVRLSESELAHHADLHLAALAWLSMQKMMLDAAARLGPQRVGSIVTNQLIQNSREALRAVAKHFRLNLDIDARVTGGVLERHSKTGKPFNADRRAERLAEGLRVHRPEIEPIVNWARKVAERTGVTWDLPFSLL